MPTAPLFSIIIVAWNSGVHLARCFLALSEGTRQDFKVILVDDGSSDGSLDGIKERPARFPLLVERLGRNLGFAAANNIGARLTHGNHVAL